MFAEHSLAKRAEREVRERSGQAPFAERDKRRDRSARSYLKAYFDFARGKRAQQPHPGERAGAAGITEREAELIREAVAEVMRDHIGCVEQALALWKAGPFAGRAGRGGALALELLDGGQEER